MPRVVENLQSGKLRYLGSGRGAMNCIHIDNLVAAVFLAVEKPQAVGQIYNLTDGEAVSKRRFIETLAAGVGVPKPPPIGVPLWVGASWRGGWRAGRKKNAPKPPRLTQARLKFLGLNLDFSIEKAKRELGYQPVKSFEQAMMETAAWYRGLKNH